VGDEPEVIGRQVAEQLLVQGGEALLAEARALAAAATGGSA
jgi:hypothetical protein